MKTQTLPINRIPEQRMARITAITRNRLDSRQSGDLSNHVDQGVCDYPENLPPPGDGMLPVAIAILSAAFVAGLLVGWFFWGR